MEAAAVITDAAAMKPIMGIGLMAADMTGMMVMVRATADTTGVVKVVADMMGVVKVVAGILVDTQAAVADIPADTLAAAADILVVAVDTPVDTPAPAVADIRHTGRK